MRDFPKKLFFGRDFPDSSLLGNATKKEVDVTFFSGSDQPAAFARHPKSAVEARPNETTKRAFSKCSIVFVDCIEIWFIH